MKTIIINALVFQVGWLCCVLAGANHLPWLGTLIALLIVTCHVQHAGNAPRELALVLIAGAIGAAWDSLLVYAGWVQYPSGILVPGTAPHWIIAMWLLFATTLNVSLKWLRPRLLLAGVLGAIAGPAAYYAGWKLGGVHFPDPVTALGILALGWSLWMPLLIALSSRLDGMARQAPGPGLAGMNARA